MIRDFPSIHGEHVARGVGRELRIVLPAVAVGRRFRTGPNVRPPSSDVRNAIAGRSQSGHGSGPVPSTGSSGRRRTVPPDRRPSRAPSRSPLPKSRAPRQPGAGARTTGPVRAARPIRSIRSSSSPRPHPRSLPCRRHAPDPPRASAGSRIDRRVPSRRRRPDTRRQPRDQEEADERGPTDVRHHVQDRSARAEGRLHAAAALAGPVHQHDLRLQRVAEHRAELPAVRGRRREIALDPPLVGAERAIADRGRPARPTMRFTIS